MEGMHALLPWWERYPLPPREITEEVEEVADLRGSLDEPQHVARDAGESFRLRGRCGGRLRDPSPRAVSAPPALKGAAFGLGVWSVSYLGLMPALGVLSPATEHPGRRNALMIAAHLVWGSATGIVFDRLQKRRPPGRRRARCRRGFGPRPRLTPDESGEARPCPLPSALSPRLGDDWMGSSSAALRILPWSPRPTTAGPVARRHRVLYAAWHSGDRHAPPDDVVRGLGDRCHTGSWSSRRRARGRPATLDVAERWIQGLPGRRHGGMRRRSSGAARATAIVFDRGRVSLLGLAPMQSSGSVGRSAKTGAGAGGSPNVRLSVSGPTRAWG